MKKELYLYSGIYSYTAESTISQMEDNKAADITLRMNTDGGDPQAAFGIIGKMVERSIAGLVTDIQVDGKAYSSGFYMLPFGTKVTALNVSDFIVHRAAYSAGYEATLMTPEEGAALVQMNNDLRAALEKKVNPKKFASVTGVTFDEIFDPTKRIDVRLTAAQALKIGLIDEITNIIDPAIAAMGKALFVSNITALKEEEVTTNKIDTIMNSQELKDKFPALFAELTTAGAQAEAERVKSWMVFNDVDAKAVAEGVKSGKAISVSEITELTRKSISAEMLGKLKEEAPAAVTAEGAAKSEKEKELATFEAEVYKSLNLKK